MKCPKCKNEQPDELSMCSGCGLVFAEWNPKTGSTAVAKPGAGAAGMGAAVYAAAGVLLLGAIAGVIHAVRHPPQEAVDITEPAEPTEPVKPVNLGPPPVPKDKWRFEGQVLDLYHVKPVAGATVVFSNTVFGTNAFEAKTDAKGAYLIDTPIKDGVGYYVLISHPDFRKDLYIDATKRDLASETWESLVNAGRQTPNLGPNFGGKAGLSTKYTFAIIPKNLTPEETAKVEAVPKD